MVEKYRPEDAKIKKVTLARALYELARFKEEDSRRPNPTDNRHKSYKFIRFLLRTSFDAHMRKTGNPFYGKVDKVQAIRASVNGSYARAVAKQQEREGKVADASLSGFIPERTWGVKVENADERVAPMLQVSIGINDDDNVCQMYCNLFLDKNRDGLIKQWFVWTDGPKREHKLTDEEVAKMLEFCRDPNGEQRKAAAQKRQGVEQPIFPKKPNVLSLRGFKLNGVFYEIIDSVPPEIPAEVYRVALEDVQGRRAERDRYEAVKKTLHAAIRKGVKDEVMFRRLSLIQDYLGLIGEKDNVEKKVAMLEVPIPDIENSIRMWKQQHPGD
jgi:hypothetical protein